MVLPPVFQADGDSIPVYIKSRGGDAWELSDRGAVSGFLTNEDIDFGQPSRRDMLARVAAEGEAELSRDYVLSRHLARAPDLSDVLDFLQVLIRASSLSLWTRQRVERAFREDLQQRVIQRVPEGQVTLGYIDDRDSPGDFKVDILLRPEEREPVVVEAIWNPTSVGQAALVLSAMRKWHPTWRVVVANGGAPVSKVRQMAYLADDLWDEADIADLSSTLRDEGVSVL